MDHYLFDVIGVIIAGYFVKSYFLHIGLSKQEAFLVREAPRWLLWAATGLVVLTLLLLVATDLTLVSFDMANMQKYTMVAFMLWVAMTLYVKWNWGVHLADVEARTKNKKEMVMLLILLMFLAMMLSQ